MTLQLSHERGERGSLTVSVGYYRLDDARQFSTLTQGQPVTEYYDSEIVPVTVGYAYDAWKGRADAFSIGLEGGAAWSRERFSRSSAPVSGSRVAEWSPAPLLSPSVAYRRALGERVELSATGRLLMGFGDVVPGAVPAFGIGAVFRP